MAKIEFYIGNSQSYITTLYDTTVPRKDEFINILKITYKIKRIDWAIDNSEDRDYKLRQLRANVILEKFK